MEIDLFGNPIESEIEDDFIPQPTTLAREEVKDDQTPVDEAVQPALFDKGEWWEEHWKGMPEFKQQDFMPYHTIFVHFENRADMERFAKLVGQNVMLTTKSIWYPEAELAEVSKLRWIANPEAKSTKKEELREILDSE